MSYNFAYNNELLVYTVDPIAFKLLRLEGITRKGNELTDANIPEINTSQVKAIIAEYLRCLKENFPKLIAGHYDPRNVIIESSMISPCDNNLQIIDKYRMELLDFDAYDHTPIFLIDVEKYLVNFDHYFYWSFGADVLQVMRGKLSSLDQDIIQRFFLLMDVIFSRTYNPWATPDTRRVREAQTALSPRRYSQASDHIIVAHLAYPLIDGLLKTHWKNCQRDNHDNPEFSQKQFLSEDGKDVLLRKLLGSNISNLAILLRGVEHFTKNRLLKENLSLFREHFNEAFSEMYNGEKAYDIISNQRNSLLHGGKPWERLFAALVNLVFVLINVLLNEQEFKQAKQQVIQRLSWNPAAFLNTTYYPPL